MIAHRVVVTGPKRVTTEAFPIPAPGADEALVETRLTLISPGTERAFFMALPNTNAQYPLYPGYSNVGVALTVGANARDLQAGDRVAAPIGHMSHGLIEARRCVKIPDALSDERAVFFNLIAIAMQGIHKARIELGESVIVLGVGLIGLFALRLAQLCGGLPVIAADRDALRLRLAEEIGADISIMSDEHVFAALRDAAGIEGANVVIESTGVAAAVPLAFQLAADKGRVILLGSSRDNTEAVNFYRDVHRKGLTIIGAHEITRPRYEHSPGQWTQIAEHEIALKLLEMERIQVDNLIHHHFHWQEFPRAYDLLAGGNEIAPGIIVDWT